MSKVIAITSGKGGTGKSTVCSELGYALACDGKKVILLELDFGLRGLDIMLGNQDRIVYDIGDLLHGECNINQAVISSGIHPNLYLAAASASIEREINLDDVELLCSGLKDYFDYVIADLPAGISLSSLVAPKIADTVLVVTTPDPVCIRDGNKIVGSLVGYDTSNVRLIINKVDKKLIQKGMIEDLDEVIDGVGAKLIGVIPFDHNIQLAAAKGERISKKTLSAKVFYCIAKRLQGEYIPLLVE